MKVATDITKTHNPFDEDYWASCLRENLTSSSYGEGLETGREYTQVPRQSFTRLWGYARLSMISLVEITLAYGTDNAAINDA